MEKLINGHIKRFSISCKDCDLSEKVKINQYVDPIETGIFIEDDWIPNDIEEVREFTIGLECIYLFF